MANNNLTEGSKEPFDLAYVNNIVDEFALAMKHKIILNSFKGKPEPIPVLVCIDRLVEELNELAIATLGTDKNAVLMEAADVACFALFAALNFKGSDE